MKIKNNIASFGWGISILFLLCCGLFTHMILRDGAENIQINPPENMVVYAPCCIKLIMGTFWLSGIGVATHLWRKPCVQVEVRPDGTAVVTRRYPFRRKRRMFLPSQLLAAEVRKAVDSEGDPYFECLLTAMDGSTAIIAEGSLRKQCDETRDRFNRAIGKSIPEKP